jgi:acyl-CoA dehydrogenase
MDFALSPRAEQLREQLRGFIDAVVEPATPVYYQQVAEIGDPHAYPPVMDAMKAEARRRGLWNLFMPPHADGSPGFGAGLTNLDYAPLCELMGRNHLISEATNCAAPDTGNMEVLAQFGTPLQQDEFLRPLLDGEIRSCFAMTEPWVASSDATNIESRIEPDGDHYVVNAHKWWTSGAASPRCRVAIVMGVSDPNADPYHRHSMVLVPFDTPGYSIVRTLPVFGHDAGGGHCETLFDNVRIPREYLLGEEGGGFAIAQARLGPGRIHHCMRAIGLAEHALELMCRRAQQRVAFGKTLAEQGVVQDVVAESRIAIEQARLLTMKAAWLMDTVGNKGARFEIAAIKVVAARVAITVIDNAIQLFGAAGVSDDWPLAAMYAHARTLRLVDGPDDVHKMQIARRELRKYEEHRGASD